MKYKKEDFYNTRIRVKNPEESERVQRFMFMNPDCEGDYEIYKTEEQLRKALIFNEKEILIGYKLTPIFKVKKEIKITRIKSNY